MTNPEMMIFIAPSVCIVLYRQYNIGQFPSPKVLQSDKQQRETTGGADWRNGDLLVNPDLLYAHPCSKESAL